MSPSGVADILGACEASDSDSSSGSGIGGIK